jgi:hypothetical protein
MNLRNLSFLKKSLSVDFKLIKFHKREQFEQLKGVSGCYIIGTKHGYQESNKYNAHQDDKVLYWGDEPIKFPYPKGLSPVFYVGQSEDLHKRISRPAPNHVPQPPDIPRPTAWFKKNHLAKNLNLPIFL